MEKSVYDMVVDEMVDRHRLVKAELQARFKKTKPFRQEPKTHKELVMDYDEFLKNESQLRTNFGDDAVDTYKLKLQDELRR